MQNKKRLIHNIAIDALFITIILVMGLVPYLGFISIGNISATILPIPVILGAALLGPKRGVLYGFVFGVSSFLIAILRPTGADALFIDPLISIVPRVLFGIIIGLIAWPIFRDKVSFKTKRFVVFPFSGMAMMIHSTLVLTMIYIRYIDDFNKFILPVLVPIVLVETLFAMIVVPVLYNALYLPFENAKFHFSEKKVSVYESMMTNYYGEALDTLIEFVNINSVYDESTVTSQTPYGKGVDEALKYIQKIAEKDEYDVKIIDGRVVEVYFGEKYNPNIAIFAHADVVPATGEWESPPFAAEVRDGKLYGRGTSDDKGPAIAAYYALKALHDNKLLIGYSVRLVLGGDEERGSSCMQYYFKEHKAQAPVYGFTPDAAFPLIYGEKGITNFEATKSVDLDPIVSIKGGAAANSVIDKVEIKLVKDAAFVDYLKAHNIKNSVKMLAKNMEVTIFGKSAHGSTPEQGINAGVLAFKHLGNFYNNPFLNHLAKKFDNPNGKTMDAFLSTPLLGDSTYNIGLVNYENGKLSFVVNFRYPENVDVETHLRKLERTLDVDITIGRSSKPLLFNPKSDFIKTLLKAYQDETGDKKSKPLAIGGGTYAKECPNTVAFGSAFNGRSGNIHSPNEHIYLADFYAQMAIYARAIHYLGRKL